MILDTGDWLVIFVYFSITLFLGFYFFRKGGSSLTEYFLSGRNLPWWLAGTSMVATTFAADTPLAVTGLVAMGGIAGNWVWWSAAIGGMLTVFFFAKLWVRAGILTDAEFVELRYAGAPAGILRGFKAIYFGLIINMLVMGWVNLAMYKILKILLPELDPGITLTVLSLFTLIYVSATGLWGVAASDVFQFVVAMFGSILLAVYALQSPAIQDAGGLVSMLPESTFRFLPVVGGGTSDINAFTLPVLSFFAYIGVQWWSSWYPGAEPGGGGYIAQRIMSSRNEKEGMYATLWFVIAHYAIRPWPWILVALASLALYPNLAEGAREEGYVMMIRDVMPSPLRGLMLAAFAGAYMSTISTQLNWGASYLLNDFYKRFLGKQRSDEHHVFVSRIITILLLVLSLIVTNYLDSVSHAWMMLLEFGAGMGIVLILRWYWERINALSEIAAMATPAIATIILHFIASMQIATHDGVRGLDLEDFVTFPGSLYINVSVTLIVVMVFVYLFGPENKETLHRFYLRVRPGGKGWEKVRKEIMAEGMQNIPQPDILLPKFIAWIAGTLMVYLALFAVGQLIFARWVEAALLFSGMGAAVWILIVSLKRDR